MQLNGNGVTPTFTNPPEAPGGDFSPAYGFAGLRWSQTAGFGYAPNPAMPHTFMAVALDTPNPDGGVYNVFDITRPRFAGIPVAPCAQAVPTPSGR